MRAYQERIKRFDKEREWVIPEKMKDYLLNIVEETGEAWNIIKWVDEKEVKSLIDKHKEEYKDYVGDMLFLILKIAYLSDIDAQEALDATLREYEQRFPAKETKGKHANILAKGIDKKYDY